MNIEDLKKYGALLEGHFENEDGTHTDIDINCAKLFEKLNRKQFIFDWIIDNKKDSIFDCYSIISSKSYIAIYFSDILSNCKINDNPRSIWCERVPEIEYKNYTKEKVNSFKEAINVRNIGIKSGKFQLRRGFEIKKGEKVLIVTDVVKNGKEVGGVAELVNEYGGEIVGAISIIDRRKEKHRNLATGRWLPHPDLKEVMEEISPFISLIQLDIDTYDPKDCPLCKNNIPIGCYACKISDIEKGIERCINKQDRKEICRKEPKIPLIKPGSKK